MPRGDRTLEHVLRRMAFGASSADLARFSGQSPSQIVEQLLNYEQDTDDVDAHVGKAEYISVTRAGSSRPTR
jgi:hypothetical protein